MNFETFLNQAWADHGKHSAAVADRLPEGARLAQKAEQVPPLANLAVHVFGEHLGEWARGLAFLESLGQAEVAANGDGPLAIRRAVETLRLASGNDGGLSAFNRSDQIRILAVAAAALSGRAETARAQVYFRRALELAQLGIAKEDPANRALAVTGNNLASALEEKGERSEEERALMILAAETGRKYWEIAGGWREVGFAEYRLAKTFLKANEVPRALAHAQECVEMNLENKGSPVELFYAYEVLAAVEGARGSAIGFSKALEHAEAFLAKVPEADREECEQILRRLRERS